MADEIRVETCAGRDVLAHLPDIARLRIAVFREYPYLYDGDLAYEERYLRDLCESPRGMVALALDGGRVVGASTGLPLADEPEGIRRPFGEAGFVVERIFYCAESVLLPSHRGQGIYRRFFAERERYASSRGFFVATFCGVERPANHPRRPPGYLPLDGIWTRLGYERRPDLRTTIAWKDLDEEGESPKPMVFWVKNLASDGR